MVRYQGQVGVFQATLPLGAPVENLPPAKNYIDELVFKQLKQVGMPPSEVCDDATFVRRVTLDVAGRLPTPAEVTAFLADTDAAKRDKLIDRLVDSGDYADYFANKWSALLRNKRETPAQARGNYAFHAWIRDSLYRNKPYDQFVREVVAASGDMASNPAVAWYRRRRRRRSSSRTRPSSSSARGCSVPSATTTRTRSGASATTTAWPRSSRRSQRQPGSAAGRDDRLRQACRAGRPSTRRTASRSRRRRSAPSRWTLTTDEDPRQALADWMAQPDNKFFAPSLVNRYWKHFFGRGLVDPEDDMRETNPATNPELLDALAKDFVASKFDLKHLVRTICRSSTYQLSSVPNRYNAADQQNFSRYYPRRLKAEVLLDAVDQVTAGKTAFASLPADTRAVQLPDNSFNAESYFLTVFGRPEASSACECERSARREPGAEPAPVQQRRLQTKLTADAGRAAALAKEAAQGGRRRRCASCTCGPSPACPTPRS